MNAVHNIHTHLNLNGNEVRNVRLERLPSDPDPVEGGVYFNLETREFRFSDGTAWESLLGGFWKLDDDGNLVTDKTVIIKKNLTIGGDMSTDGEGGQGTVTGVTSIIIDGVPYFVEDGAIDLSEAFEDLDVDVDLSGYYTKNETTVLVNTAIANLVNGAPETLDTLKEVADALAENADVVDALNAAIGNKADKATTLAGYGITDAYTRTEIDTKYSPVKTWYDDLASLIVREGNNVRIKTNIIIDGDQSAGGEGGGGTVSGITGIAVNGQTYTDTNNDGIIDLGTISGGIGEITSQMIADALGYTPLSTAGGTIESTSTSAPLVIKTNSNGWLMFRNTAGYLGEFGFTYEKIAHCTDTDGNAKAIIHTGNIGSQYVAGLIKSDGNAYVSYNATYGYVNVNGVAIGLNSNTIERVTSGKLYIQKNVTEATIINQYGGNVGIGTDSPAYKLDVNGGQARLSVAANNDAFWIAKGSQYEIGFGVGGGNINRGIYDFYHDSWMIYRAGSTNIYFPYGNIHIGTTTDSPYKLDVNGGVKCHNIVPYANNSHDIGASTTQFRYIYGSWIGSKTGEAFSLGANNAYHVYINTSGNVGIGTTGPVFKLDIAGGVRMIGTNSAAMSPGAGSLVVMDNTGAMLMFDANYIQAKTAAGTVGTKLYINDWGGDVIFGGTGSCNVGIGTSSPAYKLDVIGIVKATRFITHSNEMGLWAGSSYSSSYAADSILLNGSHVYFPSAVTMSSTLTINSTTLLQGGSNNPYLRLTYDNAYWYVQAYKTNNVSGVFLGATSARSLKVDVSGNVSIPGNLVVAGDISA